MKTTRLRDFGLDAQRAAMHHLADCYAAMDAQDEHEGPDEDFPDSPASAPFDGCDDCQVRETLHAAWPILREAAIAEQPLPVRALARWHELLASAIGKVSRSTR